MFTTNLNKAFSLIEIMIGLIVVSVMIAAFAPVITKKVSFAGVSLLNLNTVTNADRVEDRLFTYQESKDNIGGCKLTEDKLSLECPFVIPAGVTKINIVMVSPGGGGSGYQGDRENVITDKKPVNVSSERIVRIGSLGYLTNFKINYLISGGGGGGDAYYHYDSSKVIKINSREDCNKWYTNTKYYLGACISPVLSKTRITAEKAKEVCENYSNTNAKSKGHWRNISEGEKGEVSYNYSTLGCGYLMDTCGYELYGWAYDYNTVSVSTNQKSGYCITCDQIRNGELPSSYYTLKTGSDSTGSYCATNKRAGSGVYVYETDTCNKVDNMTSLKEYLIEKAGGNGTVYKHYYTYCAIDRPYGLELPESQMHKSSGGGGGAGAELTNIKIPDKVLLDNFNGYIVFLPGVGGTSGSITINSSNGEVTNVKDATDGGRSGVYVMTKPNDDSTIKWGIEVLSGKGGKTGTKGTTAKGGSRATQFRYYNGSSWTTYSSLSALKTNPATRDVFGEAEFNLGTDGKDGSCDNRLSMEASEGGTAPNSSFTYTVLHGSVKLYRGQGGSGAYYPNNSKRSSTYSGSGLISYEYSTVGIVYFPGAGGGGGSMVKIESVPVIPDEVMYITVGKGGRGSKGGSGGSGGITSIKYKSHVYSLSSGRGASYGSKGGSVCDTNGENCSFTAQKLSTGGKTPTIPDVPSVFAPRPSNVLKVSGKDGEDGNKITDYYLPAAGGMGGLSPIIEYLHSSPNNRPYSDFSIPCGGYSYDRDTRCSYYVSSDAYSAFYTGSVFSYPDKLYKGKAANCGSAGSGGGGGGVMICPFQSGSGADGQNGYVYIWWDVTN